MSVASTTRERILDATLESVEAASLGGFALEDVAATAGVSRATIYRHFPNGRTQVLREAVTREVADFWRLLADHVRHIESLEGRRVEGLMEARRQVVEHSLLQRLLASEPDRLTAELAESGELVHSVIAFYLRDLIEREELVEGLDTDAASEYLTRMFMSYVGSPGRWDLSDRAEVTRLVRGQFLAGVLAPDV